MHSSQSSHPDTKLKERKHIAGLTDLFNSVSVSQAPATLPHNVTREATVIFNVYSRKTLVRKSEKHGIIIITVVFFRGTRPIESSDGREKWKYC
jgi:hypothetical protein